MIKNSSILKAKTNFLLPFLFSSLCFPFILFVRIISFFEKKKGGREREREIEKTHKRLGGVGRKKKTTLVSYCYRGGGIVRDTNG